MIFGDAYPVLNDVLSKDFDQDGIKLRTQGVVLDINPLWFGAYRATVAALRADMLFHYPWTWMFLEDVLHLFEAIDGEAFDLKWIDPKGGVRRQINDIREGRPIPDSALPFIVKVIARPFDPSRGQMSALISPAAQG